MDYTVTELIASIKSKAMMPTSQSVFADNDIIRLINEELMYHLTPLVMRVREEYLIESVSYPVIANQASYAIPARAVGAKLRDVRMTVPGGAYRPLTRIEPELIPFKNLTYAYNVINSFYVQNNNIVLIPTPVTTDGTTLTLSYHQRPNTIVAANKVGTVTAIDTVNNQVTINATPSTFITGVLIDFIKATPPFVCLGIDYAITGVSSTTITFSTLPSNLAVGDYLALAGESIVPQIPFELFPILTQRVVVKVLESLGDQNGFQMAAARLAEMEKSALVLIEERTQGKLHKINSEYLPIRLTSRSSRSMVW